MSEQKQSAKRYIAKVKNTDTKYGLMQKIHMDAVNPVDAEGNANPYYKGTLLWLDAETGKHYQVKQMSFHTPKDGMKPEQLSKGYVCNITIDLNDSYETAELQS